MHETHPVFWFVGLLTYPFTCGEFFSHKRIVSAFSLSHDSSSNDRFSPHAGFALHGNNPLEIQLLFKSYLSLALAEKADSFRVRDSHPIPLFSEQECVSKSVLPSGRACATKAMLFSCIYHCVIIHARKKTSSAQLHTKQKKS